MATLTTPKLALPYPDGTERVMDGDNAIGALALAVENRMENPGGVGAASAVLGAGAGVYVKLAMSSVLMGAASWVDAGDILIPRSGVYYVVHQVNPQTGAGSTELTNELRLNAGLVQQTKLTIGNTNSFQSELTRVMALSGGERLSLWAKLSGASFTAAGVMYVWRLGGAFGP